MVSTKKQSAQAEECGVSKLSALKKEYRQLWEQMAELDQEWIRKHEELEDKQNATYNQMKENPAYTGFSDELSDSIPHELVKRTIGFYEVDEVDEAKI